MDNDTPTSAVYASHYSPWRHRATEEPNPIREMMAAIEGADAKTRWEFYQAVREYGLRMTAERPDSEAPYSAPRILHNLPQRETTSVVYYIKFADRVKIGFTTNLVKRLQAIPHDEVLATEPGLMDLERARHQQFSDLRVVGEWFKYEEPLVSHIKSFKAA